MDFEDPSSPTTTFNMIAQDVTATANWVLVEIDRPTVNIANVGSGAFGGGSYDQGAQVTIHAGTRRGYEFTGWTFSPSVTFVTGNSASTATTSFIMPISSVIATANWRAIGGESSSSDNDDRPSSSTSSTDSSSLSAASEPTVPTGDQNHYAILNDLNNLNSNYEDTKIVLELPENVSRANFQNRTFTKLIEAVIPLVITRADGLAWIELPVSFLDELKSHSDADPSNNNLNIDINLSDKDDELIVCEINFASGNTNIPNFNNPFIIILT